MNIQERNTGKGKLPDWSTSSTHNNVAPPNTFHHRVPVLIMGKQCYRKERKKHWYRTNVEHGWIIDSFKHHVSKHGHWYCKADGNRSYQ